MKYVPPDALTTRDEPDPTDEEPGPQSLSEWTPGLEEALIEPEPARSYRVIRRSQVPDWSR
jgi:hypothetical protein